VDAGSRLVVAVGGDGTANEVVDGLAHLAHPDVRFGFIPRGTGGDLKRSLGTPEDTHRAARALSTGSERTCDLGRVEFLDHQGRPAVRHFANVAGCGIDGQVVEKVDSTTKLLGGRISFQIAAARALLGWADQRVRWRADGGAWREEAVTCIAVCNGRFFGGGMMVAPGARIDDGLFDVTVWQGLGIGDFCAPEAQALRRLARGAPQHRTLRARVVEVEPAGAGRVPLDVDGEAGMLRPGSRSAGALRLKVPEATALQPPAA
jgi:YegS/Rv2252/BmrU family lipid kinase